MSERQGNHFQMPGEFRPSIPSGYYNFKLIRHYTTFMYGKPKLVLDLRVVDSGEYHGVEIPRYYNVARINKKRAKGRFVPPRNGDFMLEYFSLVPTRNVRLDRVSMTPLYDRIIYAEVVTVNTNNRGKELPEALRYSKVGRLIKLKDDP